MTAYLLGIAFAATHMTSLRGESAVGIVEIVAAATAGLSMLIRLPRLAGAAAADSSGDQSLVAARAMTKFWMAMLLAAGVSLLLNWGRFTAGQATPFSAYAPYAFNGILILAILAEAHAGKSMQVLRGFVLSSVVILIGYVITASAGISAERFEGLTTNPNQAALYCLAVVLTGLILARQEKSKAWKALAVSGALLAVFVGRSTQSDALAIAIVITLAALGLALLFYTSKISVDLTLLLMLGVLTCALAVFALFTEAVSERGEDIYWSLAYGDQDTVRALLWRNGIEAWKEAPFFGNGPGAWSGISGPFGGQEAHNAFIDWLSIGGIIGFLPIIWLMGVLARYPWKENVVPLAGVVAVVAFGLFHFTFRQPFFWLPLFAVMAGLQPRIRNANALRRNELAGLGPTRPISGCEEPIPDAQTIRP